MDAWDAFRLSERVRLDNYMPNLDEIYELAHTDLIELDRGMRFIIQDRVEELLERYGPGFEIVYHGGKKDSFVAAYIVDDEIFIMEDYSLGRYWQNSVHWTVCADTGEYE